MAFQPNDPNMDDDDEEQGGPGQTPGQGPSQSATISGTGGGVPGATSPQPQKSGGSGWTNLQTYIDKNKPQAAKLGAQIGSFVKDAGAKADTARETGIQEFNKSVDPGAYNFDKNVVDRVVADPTKANTNDFNQVKNYLNTAYNGPKTFEETDSSFNAKKAIEDSRKVYDQSQDYSGGQQTLLKEKIQKPRATQGVTNLNSLFAQSSPEAKASIQAAKDDYNALTLDEKLAQANAAANQRIADAQKAAGDVRSGTGSVIDNRAKSILEEELAARSNQGQQYGFERANRNMQAQALENLAKTGNLNLKSIRELLAETESAAPISRASIPAAKAETEGKKGSGESANKDGSEAPQKIVDSAEKERKKREKEVANAASSATKGGSPF